MVVCPRVANLDLGKEIAQLLGETQSPREMGHAIHYSDGNGLKPIQYGTLSHDVKNSSLI
jgi:hypothetical protein